MAGFRRKKGEPPATDIMELLNLTPMMDVFTVLVVFLLITAVFTSITIMDLSVPTSAGGAAASRPNFAIEVVVRKAGLEIANGRNVEASIPLKDGKYDLKMLSELLQGLKAKYPEKEDATVLMEPKIQYDYLVQVMDTVRSAGSNTLFPKISIGDAP
ncbi:MAG TPA: biopolymer transporter ExbD [Geomonas sp.]|nr:biopolymer transporter ExbD [Geomonas sp.]